MRREKLKIRNEELGVRNCEFRGFVFQKMMMYQFYIVVNL